MTKQEAISLLDGEIIRCRMAPKINGCQMTEDWKRTIEVCEIAIEAIRAQEERRWIPVTERLPDDWVDVLGRLQCGDCVVVVKSGPIWRERFTNIRLEDRDITNWMPLPEPPKEDS